MSRTTSVRLPEDVTAAVKASGLPLLDLIRRGLGTPAVQPEHRDPAADRLTAAVAATRLTDRLDQLEHRVTALEQARPAADPWSPGQIDGEREEHNRRRTRALHRQLLDQAGPPRPVIVDGAAASVTLGMSRGWAQHWLRLMEGLGLASRADDGRPPYRWLIHDGRPVADPIGT